MLSLFLLIPFLLVVLLNLCYCKVIRIASFYVATAFFALQGLLILLMPDYFWATSLPLISRFFPFDLYLDKISSVMLLAISIVGIATLFTAKYTRKDNDSNFNMFNILLLACAGMNGIVLVRDVFSLYVFIEITAVSSYILISLDNDLLALEGAFKYLMLSAVATIMMLTAIALLIMSAGDTSFSTIFNAIFFGRGSTLMTYTALALFVSGLFIKGGIVPFHGWLPDAYSAAPSSVSVFLAGIVTKTTGIYTLIRLVTDVFGFSRPVENMVLLVGAFSIYFGALAALGQKDFKRMLAYSSISQMGYVVIGIGTGTALGIAGAVFHLLNHAIFKSGLFVNSSAVEQQTGTTNMDELGGLASKMPVTGTTSIIGLLATAGVPPLSGFWSKLIIILALWFSGHQIYALLAVLGSVLTLAYFLSMQHRVFFGIISEKFKDLKEANTGLVFIQVFLAVLTLAIGIFFPFLLNTFILPIGSLFG